MGHGRLALLHPLREKRIGIRRFVNADVGTFAELLTDEKVTRYLPLPRELRSAEGAELLLGETIARYDTDAPLLAYAVGEHGGEHLIGFCGMNPLSDDEVELMYAVAPARWGEGFGSTIAAALCAHVSAVDPQLRRVAFVHPDNEPSISIARRLGFASLGLVRHPMFDRPVLKFVEAPSAPILIGGRRS